MVETDITPDCTVYCAHYVERKKRRCKLTPLKHSTYCAEHAAHHTDPSNTDLIPCPLDPAHFISSSKLEQHLKVCNARKYDHSAQPYFKENVNVPPPHEIRTLLREPLSKLPIQDLIDTCLELINYGSASKICKLNETGPISEEDIDHYRPLFQKGEKVGSSALRHATQQVALVNTLAVFQEEISTDTSSSDTCFVELGAGSGKLSQWFHHKVNDSYFVLVDRQMCRKKADGYFRKQKSNFVRLKMDIKDIDVTGIPDVDAYKKICFACKHLCGGATDMALVSAVQSAQLRETSVLIALCCHHLCSWELYTGKDYLVKLFKPEQFYTLSSLSAWATCFKLDTMEVDNVEVLNNVVQKFRENPESFIQGEHLVLDRNLQWYIGRCAKTVLNDGRAQFMLNHGFRVQFYRYVDVNVSPENTALLCFKSAAAT
ncbi:hypothetical protein ACHWQZ_G008659 [Mnemiopsis leidyi]